MIKDVWVKNLDFEVDNFVGRKEHVESDKQLIDFILSGWSVGSTEFAENIDTFSCFS